MIAHKSFALCLFPNTLIIARLSHQSLNPLRQHNSIPEASISHVEPTLTFFDQMAAPDLDVRDQDIDTDSHDQEKAFTTTPGMTLPVDGNSMAVEKSYNIRTLATIIRRIEHFYQEFTPPEATQVAFPKRATFFRLPRRSAT